MNDFKIEINGDETFEEIEHEITVRVKVDKLTVEKLVELKERLEIPKDVEFSVTPVPNPYQNTTVWTGTTTTFNTLGRQPVVAYGYYIDFKWTDSA